MGAGRAPGRGDLCHPLLFVPSPWLEVALLASHNGLRCHCLCLGTVVSIELEIPEEFGAQGTGVLVPNTCALIPSDQSDAVT